MAKQQPQIKTAPHSKESEMMVLGCMLTSVNSLNIGSDLLNDTDFYFTEHKIIFKTLQETYKKDKPADIHIVGEELKRINKLDAVGGISYLTTLAQYAGTSAFVEEYAQIIKDKAILRQMIEAAQIIEKTAIEEAYDVPTILDEAQSKFFHISQVANKDTGILLKDVISGIKAKTRVPYLQELQEKQEQYQKRGEDDLGLTGIPTHFIDLDKMLNGFSGSNLMILAARPAM